MPETTTITLTPYLCCRNATEAAAFYEKALGAKTLGIHAMPDGKVIHAALRIGESAQVYLSDEFPEMGGVSPLGLGGSPVTLHLQVPDADAVFQRAIDAGCTVTMPLEDQFWGDRYGSFKDPYGHEWSVGTPIREVSPEEMQQAMAAMASGGNGG